MPSNPMRITWRNYSAAAQKTKQKIVSFFQAKITTEKILLKGL
jgi:hypothetical protein